MTTNWKAEAIDALQTVAWGNWAERCDFLSNLPMRLVQEFAILCAEKALSAWERDYPQDGRPKAAIAAAKAFLGGAIGEEACGEAARGAANAANAAAYTANAAYCAARAAKGEINVLFDHTLSRAWLPSAVVRPLLPWVSATLIQMRKRELERENQ